MPSQDSAIHPARGLESTSSVQESAVAPVRALYGMRAVLAAAIAIVFALPLSTAARAATITVNSLTDPGAAGICALRDAITAANGETAVNGCPAGTGNDMINFSVTGTTTLADTLPEVTNILSITGPITITGGIGVGQGMEVAPAATLSLKNVTIANGGNGAGIGTGLAASLIRARRPSGTARFPATATTARL